MVSVVWINSSENAIFISQNFRHKSSSKLSWLLFLIDEEKIPFFLFSTWHCFWSNYKKFDGFEKKKRSFFLKFNKATYFWLRDEIWPVFLIHTTDLFNYIMYEKWKFQEQWTNFMMNSSFLMNFWRLTRCVDNNIQELWFVFSALTSKIWVNLQV